LKHKNNLTINIFTHELIWMGQVDSVTSLIHRSSWAETLYSELIVSKHAQGVEEIQIGRILVVNNQKDKALIVEDLNASLDDESIVFSCIQLKDLLNYRIAHPSDAGTFTQRRQSDVMMLIASGNLITQTRDNDRKFWNDARTKNLFSVAPLKGLGNIIDFTVNWESGQLGDVISSVARNSNRPLGWNVLINDTNDGFVMDVYQGEERHINQTILPPVVFSEDFGNIKNATYEYSIRQWRNVIFMTWEEPTDARTLRITPVTSTNRGATVSFNRKEMIYNSTKQSQGEVSSDGRSELNKRPHVETFDAEIINNENTMSTYQKNWDLGDIVTVQSKEVLKEKMISIDAQITEIEEIYDAGEYSIKATFGLGKLTFVDLIKQEIKRK
jgi:hypothetical protein